MVNLQALDRMKFFSSLKEFTTWLTLVTTICSLAGLYLIYNASNTLAETKKTDQGNFILGLNRDFFFNDRLTQIRIALETNQKILVEDGGKYDDVQLDDYIGFFETLSDLLGKGILDKKLVDDNFSYYIKEAYDNQEVKNYINDVRKQYGKNVYQRFLELGYQESKVGY